MMIMMTRMMGEQATTLSPTCQASRTKLLYATNSLTTKREQVCFIPRVTWMKPCVSLRLSNIYHFRVSNIYHFRVCVLRLCPRRNDSRPCWCDQYLSRGLQRYLRYGLCQSPGWHGFLHPECTLESWPQTIIILGLLSRLLFDALTIYTKVLRH